MDETKTNRLTVFESLVVLFFIFAVLAFIIFRFGKNEVVVKNKTHEEARKTANVNEREEVFRELKEEYNSEIFTSYLNKIYEESRRNKEVDINVFSETLARQLQAELQQKTALPEWRLEIVGPILDNNTANRKTYLEAFDALYDSAKQKGVFVENKIFLSQVQSSDRLLPLSDYDKGTILRSASDYKLWARAILDLPTPKGFENKSLIMARDLLNIAYVLEKVVEEKDGQVYLTWIEVYGRLIFDILANMYVQ